MEYECIKSELDLFEKPSKQRMIQKGFIEELSPISPPSKNSDIIEFDLISSDDSYIDPSYIYYCIRGKINAANGSDNLETVLIAPINNFGHSLFESVLIELNGKVVQSASVNYSYRTYFETLLNYGEDAKKSALQSQLFYKDDADKFDKTTLDSPNNGFLSRYNITKASKKFEVMAHLHADIFNQTKLILNKVNMKFKFKISRPEFYLIGDATSKSFFEIESFKLYIRKVQLNPDVITGHIAAFRAGGKAIYPIKRVELLKNTIASGVTSADISNLTNGKLPVRCIFAMADNNTMTGVYNKNPFNFKHNNIKTFCLNVNGNEVPHKALTIDASNGEYIRAYHSLFSGIDKPVFVTGNNIERTDWTGGYAIFAFDLTPDLCSGDYQNISNTGTVSVNLTFKESLAAPINLISYLEFEDQIEITEERKVIFETK